MSFSHIDPVPQHQVRFSRRLAIYLSVWLLAALALEVFLRPEGLTETSASPLEQRLWLPIYTPLMVILGLAQAATWPRDHFAHWAVAAAFICFLVHGIFTLRAGKRAWFLVLACIHII